VAAVVGEAGVGKSRLVYEFTHWHRMQGCLVLEAASVSYGKATSYLPVIDLLKGYFNIQDAARRRGREPGFGAPAAPRDLRVSSSLAADVVLGVFAIVTTPAGIFPELDIPVVCGDLNSGGRALRPAR
jgi:hypothetical protein